MARARNIKPGMYKNEDLAECSVWARYIFPGLWMLADRDGRLEDRPKRIKGELLPFDTVDVEPLLRELTGHHFIERYKIEGQPFIQISKFSTHQTPHYSEKPSLIKPPPLQENDPCICDQDSEKPPPIKRGSQPPDSLIPDSLIPDLTPLARSDESPSLAGSVKSALKGAVNGDAVAHIPLIGDQEFGVSAEFLKELEAAYPQVDGPATLREIRVWCIANPVKRKTARGAARFVNRWFERVQNGG